MESDLVLRSNTFVEIESDRVFLSNTLVEMESDLVFLSEDVPFPHDTTGTTSATTNGRFGP